MQARSVFFLERGRGARNVHCTERKMVERSATWKGGKGGRGKDWRRYGSCRCYVGICRCQGYYYYFGGGELGWLEKEEM